MSTRYPISLAFLAFLALLGACVYGPEGRLRSPSSPEFGELGEALDEWEAAGLDDATVCREELSTVRVAVARTDREMFSLAGKCGPTDGPLDEWEELHCWDRLVGGGRSPRRAAGAFRMARAGGVWPFALFGDWYPLIVVWGGLDGDATTRLVRHEAVHWIQVCSGRGYVPQRPHGDPDVWCPEGCPGRWGAP